MTQRMSCSMTIESVRDRSKTVTRRHVATWQSLAVGDHLVLVEKAQGLKAGEHQVVLDEVEIVDVRVESLAMVLYEKFATHREGLGHMTKHEFVAFWLKGHGYPANASAWQVQVRRIEWRYVTVGAPLEIVKQYIATLWIGGRDEVPTG